MLRYFTLPVTGQVAWPGHLVEDRVNNSESPGDRGNAMFEAYDEDGADNKKGTGDDCSFKDDPSTWDNEDDVDPLADYEAGSTDASAYYGPNDDGPSADPALGNLLTGLTYEAGVAEHCEYGAVVGALEVHGAGGQSSLKTQATGSGAFFADTAFNPGTAPGGPAPDTTVCAHDNAVLFGSDHPARCGGSWFFAGFIDVPNESPDAYWLRTFRWAAYADVSFGDTDGFDPAGDGDFDAVDGVFDVAPLNADAADVLPAGADDAHQYGDEQCNVVTPLSTGGDAVATGTFGFHPVVGEQGPSWSCVRDDWAAQGQVDCGLAAEELACYMLPKVGDPYDLWDIECHDNDVMGMETTSESGPLGPQGSAPDDNLDCDKLPPS